MLVLDADPESLNAQRGAALVLHASWRGLALSSPWSVSTPPEGLQELVCVHVATGGDIFSQHPLTTFTNPIQLYEELLDGLSYVFWTSV